MSYEAANHTRFAYSADGRPIYNPMAPPTSSPVPTYNNPNGAVSGGRDTAENNTTAAVTAGINASGSQVVKRKRGRPRRYSPDASVSPASRLTSPPLPGQAVAQAGDVSSLALSSGKKARGRPRGSVNKQQPAASGSAAAGFMPHILDVKAGEDVLTKLMSFSQNSARDLCILSANGVVSNVTLRQTATSGGTVTYEGRFEILSLSGSFMVSESGGQRSRTGGLSVALSGADGRVLGGNVSGLLTAASPVQVIVGSFLSGNEQKETKAEDVNRVCGTSGGGSLSESSGGGLGSPLSNPQGMGNMHWR